MSQVVWFNSLGNDSVPQISIRPLSASDKENFLHASRASVELHHPWLTAPTTEAAFDQYIEKYAGERNACFLILSDQQLAGVVNLNEIVRGVFLSAYSAFYAFHGFAGQGVMTQGLQLVIQHAFDQMGLHRIEANIQPDNQRSLALVERCGFRREGFSPRYLYINGAWRDHERWAFLAD